MDIKLMRLKILSDGKLNIVRFSIHNLISKIMLVTLLTLVTFPQISGWRPFTVEFQNISYQIIHPGIVDGNITTKGKVHDIYLNILKDISSPFLDLILLHDSGNGKFDMVYANKTVDLCMFLNNRKSNPMINIVYNLMSDYGELPKRCPVVKKRYAFLNVTIDPEKFPSFLPDHIFHTSVVGWIKENGRKKILLTFNMNVVVERSYKSNRKG